MGIEKMFYRYDEMRQSVFLSLSSLLTIEIRYEDSIFKEIEYIEDYDFEAFVGNIGGYIGLFLGYALLQIPGILFSLLSWCGKTFFDWNRTEIHPTETCEDGQKICNGKSSDHLQESCKPVKNTRIHINIIKNLIKQEVETQLESSHA